MAHAYASDACRPLGVASDDRPVGLAETPAPQPRPDLIRVIPIYPAKRASEPFPD